MYDSIFCQFCNFCQLNVFGFSNFSNEVFNLVFNDYLLFCNYFPQLDVIIILKEICTLTFNARLSLCLLLYEKIVIAFKVLRFWEYKVIDDFYLHWQNSIRCFIKKYIFKIWCNIVNYKWKAGCSFVWIYAFFYLP